MTEDTRCRINRWLCSALTAILVSIIVFMALFAGWGLYLLLSGQPDAAPFFFGAMTLAIFGVFAILLRRIGRQLVKEHEQQQSPSSGRKIGRPDSPDDS